MKKLTLSFVLFFILSQIIYSQGDQFINNSIQDKKEVIKKFAYSLYTMEGYEKRESRVKGSRYFPENWAKGEIILNDSETVSLPMKFNTVQERFELKTNDLIYAIYAPQKIDYIKLHNRKFIYKEIETDEGKEEIFVESLANGKCQLYKRIKGTILQPSYNSSLSVGNTSSKIYLEDFYYIQLNNESPEKIKTRRRRVWKALDDKKDKMKSYIKDNNLRTRKEEDLIKAVEYYNSL